MTQATSLRGLSVLVGAYVALALLTVITLVIMQFAAPELATQEAWIHAVIVAVFAIILPLRLRAARAGDAGALRAVGVICAVLLVANLVEAVIPGLFPTWMRIEMIAIACLMGAALVAVARARATND